MKVCGSEILLTVRCCQQEADLVSVALGLLINLAEASRSSCRRLLGLPSTHTTAILTHKACSRHVNAEPAQPTCLPGMATSQQQDVSADSEATESLLPLLCLLTQVRAMVKMSSLPSTFGFSSFNTAVTCLTYECLSHGRAGSCLMFANTLHLRHVHCDSSWLSFQLLPK